MSAVVVIIILLIIYYNNINLSEFLLYVFEFEYFYSSIGYFISLFLTIILYIFLRILLKILRSQSHIYIFSEGCYVVFFFCYFQVDIQLTLLMYSSYLVILYLKTIFWNIFS